PGCHNDTDEDSHPGLSVRPWSGGFFDRGSWDSCEQHGLAHVIFQALERGTEFLQIAGTDLRIFFHHLADKVGQSLGGAVYDLRQRFSALIGIGMPPEPFEIGAALRRRRKLLRKQLSPEQDLIEEEPYNINI